MTAYANQPEPDSPAVRAVQPFAGTGNEMDESDARTLRRALGVIKAARAEAKSSDAEVARKAANRLGDVLCYLAGFLDAKGAGVALNTGFQSVFQSSLIIVDDPEKQLDEFVESLEASLRPSETRIILQIIGGGLILVGIGLKML